MGASFSTVSPVKALIGQFDRLQLCSKDKEKATESSEPTRSHVVTQPTPANIASHSTGKTAKHEPNSAGENKECSDAPSVMDLVPEVAAKKTDMRTGENFAHVLESVRSRLEASITQVLSELEEVESMPDEAESAIRIAAGKAQLLVRKKLSKFEELVKKNLNPIEGDPQSATVDDLEGYWALVEIELHDIDECFKKVDAWRASGWQRTDSVVSQKCAANADNNNVTRKKKIAPLRLGTALNGNDPSTLAKHAEKQKAAAAIRRKALAEAKQRIREAQQVHSENDMNSPSCSDVMMIL